MRKFKKVVFKAKTAFGFKTVAAVEDEPQAKLMKTLKQTRHDNAEVAQIWAVLSGDTASVYTVPNLTGPVPRPRRRA